MQFSEQGSRPGAKSDHQSSDNRGKRDAACVRKSVEYMSKHLYNREQRLLSLHPHNDRGSGVSDAELGILAGAGPGSRNAVWKRRTDRKWYYHGCYEYVFTGSGSGLGFSNMSESVGPMRLTRMQVSPRQPYAGELVFTAFSGSHQDAIAKGMAWRRREESSADMVGFLTFLWIKRWTPLRDHYDPYQQSVRKGGVNYNFKTELWNQPSAENERRGRLSCKRMCRINA